MRSTAAPKLDPRRVNRLHVALLLAVPALLVFWRLAIYFDYAAYAVNYHYGIDYGEGVIWQQALLMPGPRMYGDIHTFPYLVFHYPPLYHAVVRIAAATGADMLFTGRLVSILSTIATCILVAVASRRVLADQGFTVGAAWALAVLAGLMPLCFKPVALWSVLMRSDMLGLALTFGGFVLMLHAVRREVLGHAAMVLFVLGVFTKQIFIAAPAASLLVWLLRDPRVAVKFGLTGLVLGGLVMGWLTWVTGGGFVRHVFLYNINPFSLRTLFYNFWSQRTLVLYALLAIAGFLVLLWWGWSRLGLRGWSSLRAGLREDPRAYRLALVVLYILASAALLVTMGKEGASYNYLIEWFAVACVALATLMGWSAAMLADGGVWRAAGVLAPAALALQLGFAPARLLEGPEQEQAKTAELDALTDMVRAADRPVLSDHMVVLLRAGKEIPLESAIFHSLSSTGVWDERPFVAMLERGDFALVTTDGDEDSFLYRGRYTEAVRAAIARAYPVKRKMGGQTVHLPR